jgi:hypothetical protein
VRDTCQQGVARLLICNALNPDLHTPLPAIRLNLPNDFNPFLVEKPGGDTATQQTKAEKLSVKQCTSHPLHLHGLNN